MTIEYALYQNKLTEAADLYAARVLISGSAELEAIADRIVAQGTTVTRTDVIAVLESAVVAVENLLLAGQRVNFGGLFDCYPRIRGKFNGVTDHYDPARHKIDVGATAGARVRKTVRENASVTKLATVLPKPLVLQYSDLDSGEVNQHITPGKIGTINGSRLSFNASAADEGIYLIKTTDGTETKVTAIQKNKPSELVFMIPALYDASYRMEVRKRFSPTGELRSGQLDAVLSATPVTVPA